MQIDNNPLIVPILRFLQARSDAVSEHELITQLKPELDNLQGLANDAQLALFQVHFLVMNALYRLQGELIEEGLNLEISPLQIRLHTSAQTAPAGQALPTDATDGVLAAYYLDFANLRDTDAAAVDGLLNQFWQRYLAQDQHHAALSVLGLSVGVEWGQIQSSYRKLSASLHPDRGGDSGEFIRVREAYEILRQVYGPQRRSVQLG